MPCSVCASAAMLPISFTWLITWSSSSSDIGLPLDDPNTRPLDRSLRSSDSRYTAVRRLIMSKSTSNSGSDHASVCTCVLSTSAMSGTNTVTPPW